MQFYKFQYTRGVNTVQEFTLYNIKIYLYLHILHYSLEVA